MVRTVDIAEVELLVAGDVVEQRKAHSWVIDTTSCLIEGAGRYVNAEDTVRIERIGEANGSVADTAREIHDRRSRVIAADCAAKVRNTTVDEIVLRLAGEVETLLEHLVVRAAELEDLVVRHRCASTGSTASRS